VEPSVARELGLVGVAARACGLDVDARFHMPLSDLSCENCSPRLEITGDVMARTSVRSRELDDSLRLLELDLTRLAALPGQPGQTGQPSQKNETPATCAASAGHAAPAHAAPLRTPPAHTANATAGRESGGPATDFTALPPHTLAVAQVEGWRGEVCHVALTDSQGRILVYKVIDPSFHNWTGLAVALRGNQISDFPLCNKSFNLSYCGHDL